METNIWAGAFLVAIVTVVAVYVSIILRRKAPRGGFFSDSDRAASVFSCIATMFSVLLALVILLSVETYTETRSNAHAEADSVLEQFHLAAYFPSRDQYRLQSELVCYGRAVVADEWQRMRTNGSSPVVDGWSSSIDAATDAVDLRDAKAETGFGLFLEQTLERQDQRRGRLEGAAGSLPSMLWPILFLGAFSVLLYVIYYADRAERATSQAIQVGLVTALLGSSLVLITALDHPFSTTPGAISPDKMGRSLTAMERDLSASIDARDLHATLPCDEAGRPLPADPVAETFPDGSTMARIVEAGQVRIGVSYGTALFGELDPVSGRVSGFDADVGREIAKALGLREDQVDFVDTLIEDRIPALQAGEVDLVIEVMTITEQRRELVEFSRPYFIAGQSILVLKDSRTVSSLRDLGGKRVCVIAETTNAQTLQAVSPGTELVILPTMTACLGALRSGEVDAFSTDDIILAGFAAGDDNLTLVGGQFTKEPYGVAVPKGQNDMADFVDGVINAMIDDGRWGMLYYKYLGDIPGLASVETAKDALAAETGQ
jgi:ABC-type amino acid transport substrate-binding protein